MPEPIALQNLPQFIGTKRLHAQAMTRGEYNSFRGWTIPLDEDPTDLGYLVVYTDGGKPNTPHYPGYVSWSPAEQFVNAYRPINAMTFGLAIEALKRGCKVARRGWNGKGMWLMLVPEGVLPAELHLFRQLQLGTSIRAAAFIGMKTADDTFVPWLASQTDMLAEDWEVVE